ncbi:cytochrome P450 [Amycolatopsis sp. PS_44_ISF1]|uniref:cytochrome P450 n=1 Tax=Amycolatopsis sp. PS_44_ISF1 TaxID=2974917 RepID=UPI0028E018C1|nr:cytochrome P450 [Amycolatopsis sp. PS_44_ISF1]MDT8914501.1 cytochrome P450 [Amycolatopsis sp. PS_44_ISF1]
MSTGSPELPLRYPFPLGELGGLPPLVRWAQAHRPVCPVLLPSGDRIWMLTRRDDIAEVFADSRFSRRLGDDSPRLAGPDITTVERGLFHLDPPDHTRVRQVVSRFFTRRAVQDHRRLVTEQGTRLLDAMADGPDPADLVAAYAQPLQFRVMRRVLGVPEPLWPEHERIFRTMASITSGPAEVAEETANIRGLAARILAVGEPSGDNPVGALLAARRAGDLSADEVAGTVFVLLFTGTDAVIAPTAEGALILMQHRNQLKDCLAGPERWALAAEEVLRFYHNGVLGFPIIATEDVELHGTTIRAGDGVAASMQAATWDPAHVRHPEKFRVGRKETAEATFGAGPHYCLGSQLARVYLATALRTLFERLPELYLAINAEEVPWRNDIVFTRPAIVPVAW